MCGLPARAPEPLHDPGMEQPALRSAGLGAGHRQAGWKLAKRRHLHGSSESDLMNSSKNIFLKQASVQNSKMRERQPAT